MDQNLVVRSIALPLYRSCRHVGHREGGQNDALTLGASTPILFEHVAERGIYYLKMGTFALVVEEA